MKKLISTMLALVLIFSLIGCHNGNEIRFYYPRTEIQYGIAQGVIAAESRDIAGEADLAFLLKVYLEGPVSQELYSPFPRGTALEDLITEDKTIRITLSGPFTLLEDLDYIIACACIASTCFDLTDAEAVTITAGDTEMTLTRENLALTDLAASIPE